jgi:hypothetical protein
MTSLASQPDRSKTLRAYIDRRDRVWARVKAENPNYTETEIEARMEQFGV